MQSMDFAEHHHLQQHQNDPFSTQHHTHKPNNTPHPCTAPFGCNLKRFPPLPSESLCCR
jgi:hypothetical protein